MPRRGKTAPPETHAPPQETHAPPPDGEEELYASQQYWRQRYAGCAPETDTFEWFLDWESLAPLLDGCLKKRHDVLDVGCGASTLLMDMRAAGYGGRLVGVDYVREALDVVRAAAAAARVDLVVGDCRDLDFCDGEFDAVVDKGTVDAMISGGPDAVVAACAECARVLRHGGRFVVCSHHRADADGDLDDDAWLGAVVGGLASRDEADAAAWRLDVHALAGAAEGDAPCVYVFTKCRSHRGAGLEVEFHEHG